MKLVLVLIATLGANLLAQEIGVVGYGYGSPTPLVAAPGQLITLIVDGINPAQKQIVRAPGDADLPTSLSGVSVGYWQGTTRSVPILEVHPFSTCLNPFARIDDCKSLAAITVQIPFDAQSCPQCVPLGGMGIALGVLAVLQGGSVRGIDVQPFADQVHILTNCDPFMKTAYLGSFSSTGLPCPSIVTHADGSLVSVKNPAKAGEEVVAYAVGLGQTNPPSVTGKLVTAAASTETTFRLDFNFRPNALATKPLSSAPPPLFSGTTPGYVGLYQVNFVVPPVPQGTPACVEPPAFPPGQNVIQSNLTVSVGGAFSFDGARICVEVPNQ